MRSSLAALRTRLKWLRTGARGLGGRRRLPSEVEAALDRARRLVPEGDWTGLAACLEPVLERFEAAATPEVYARLGLAYRQTGRHEEAAAMITRGRARFPGNLRIDTEWAQLAAASEDWPETIARYEEILSQHRPAPSYLYPRLATAYRQAGDFVLAETVITQARAQFPGDMRLDIEWAQLPLARQDWPEAVTRHETILKDHAAAPVDVYRAWRGRTAKDKTVIVQRP